MFPRPNAELKFELIFIAEVISDDHLYLTYEGSMPSIVRPSLPTLISPCLAASLRMRLLQYQLRWKAFYTASVAIGIVIRNMLMLINLAYFRVLTPYVRWYYLETHNRRMRDINHPILVVAILLLVLSTAVSRITSYSQCHPLKSL
jgi:hypothetical protein